MFAAACIVVYNFTAMNIHNTSPLMNILTGEGGTSWVWFLNMSKHNKEAKHLDSGDIVVDLTSGFI